MTAMLRVAGSPRAKLQVAMAPRAPRLPTFFATLASLACVWGCTDHRVGAPSSAPSPPDVARGAVPPPEANDEPNPAYTWLVAEQRANATGLLTTIEGDRYAQLYNNALAAIAFVRFGDPDAAATILRFYQDRLDAEFYGPRREPRGFFQQRDAATGEPMRSSDRWMGDNAWLLIATLYYEREHPSHAFHALASALRQLLVHLRTGDGAFSYCASGWHGDGSPIADSGHTEGNLDAHAALKLDPETGAQAREVRGWLDFRRHNYRFGPLDIRGWRVLSLGAEYGYCLSDIDRIDRSDLQYSEDIALGAQRVRGFVNCSLATCPQRHDTVFAETTGSVVAAYYLSGFTREGDAFLGEMDRLFVPARSGAGIPFVAVESRDKTYSWAKATRGGVAPAAWYLFSKAKFNPYTLRSMAGARLTDPVAHVEAEEFDVKTDPAGCLSTTRAVDESYGGEALRVARECTATIAYSFKLLPSVSSPTVRVRWTGFAPGAAVCVAFDESSEETCFQPPAGATNATISTYAWTAPHSVRSLARGLHAMRVTITDHDGGGTLDAIRIDGIGSE